MTNLIIRNRRRMQLIWKLILFSVQLFGSPKRMVHTRNKWVCCDFKERTIVPAQYAVRTVFLRSGQFSSQIVAHQDIGRWEVACKEANRQLNGAHSAGTFAVAGSAASSGR
jgi:hypothetical protein